MAELRAYDPSWRDRIASALAGESRAGSARHNMTIGLLGSAGLGNQGIGLMDITPAGIPLAVNDSERAFSRGNTIQGLLNALAVIPAAKMPAQAVRSGGTATSELFARVPSSGYNPIPKPQRPFAADYPNVTPEATGKLTHTIDGDPISARYVVGRNEIGGGDVALPGGALDEIAKALTGRGISPIPKSAIGNDLGRVSVNRITRDPQEVFIRAGLSPESYNRVANHEIGHVIDQKAGEIPLNGVIPQANQNYSALNSGSSRSTNLMLPGHNGYIGDDVHRELMAEAIRAYSQDPNYFKTIAPALAKRVREYVNTHPEISKIIQFNSIGGLFGLAGLSDWHDGPENNQPPKM